jgi:hypothetical protein
MTVYYRLENRRRDKVEGGKPPNDMPINVMEEYDLATGKSSDSNLTFKSG